MGLREFGYLITEKAGHGPDRRQPILLSAIVLLYTAASSRRRMLSSTSSSVNIVNIDILDIVSQQSLHFTRHIWDLMNHFLIKLLDGFNSENDR